MSMQTGGRILLDFRFSCRDEIHVRFQQKLPVFRVFGCLTPGDSTQTSIVPDARPVTGNRVKKGTRYETKQLPDEEAA